MYRPAFGSRTAPLSGELAPVLGADHEGNDELGGKTVYEADYQELSDGSCEAGQDTSGCSSADNVSITGLSQSINPGVLCSDTVLVVMMNNGSYLRVAYSSKSQCRAGGLGWVSHVRRCPCVSLQNGQAIGMVVSPNVGCSCTLRGIPSICLVPACWAAACH